MKLYDHQQKIIDEDPKKTGLFLGTGAGKTLTALLLARGYTLVICPKTQKEDRTWERQLEKMQKDDPICLIVVSKEEFRRDWEKLAKKPWNTLIVDEAHTCLGATPTIRYVKKQAVPKVSQLYEALEAFNASARPERLYLCTATIIRSPMTVWAAGRLLGRDWNFYEWRNAFYTRLPMPGREVWAPKKSSDVKNRLAAAVRGLGYVGRLQDFFDVPDQTFITKHIELTEKQKQRIKQIPFEFPDPIVQIGKKHQIENGVLAGNEFQDPEIFENGKIEKLLELHEEFPKMIVFAKYTAQIEAIKNAFMKTDKSVYVLDGSTKDRGGLIELARNDPNYIFIAQAQISAGWELPECPVMVFASRTYSFVDYDQAKGRIQRANNIKKNLYINLVVKGGPDEGVDESLENKSDFSERIYAEKN